LIRFPFLKQISWQVLDHSEESEIARLLINFDEVYLWNEQPFTIDEQKIQPELITKSSLCVVYKVTFFGVNYYLKHYNQEENQILRYFRQSKVRTEWENMLLFHQLGLPAAKVVAYGEALQGFISKRGLFITEEIKNTTDLVSLADSKSELLKNTHWVKTVSGQIAEITRILHQNRFAHNDLKWRNILVDIKAKRPQVYLIDCPAGMKWRWPFLSYRIIKDLACLDKRAKYNLSRTQRMAFYKDYAQCSKLMPYHKKQIRKILGFFHNRE
jgi:tRNA A-37 threonylcarbamoyl transferase component Bud32